MAEDKWRDSYYVRAYELALGGMGDVAIAEELKVTYKTWMKWKRAKPALKKALIRARHKKDKESAATYLDTVFDRLPKHLQEVWNEINASKKETNHIEKMESILSGKGTRARQQLFLYALIHCNYNASKAYRKVNITKRTFDSWLNTDPAFRELIEEMEHHKDNLIEGQFMRLVRKGVPVVVMKAAETRLASRGYARKATQISGEIGNVPLVSINDIPMPMQEKKALLQRIRDAGMARIPYSQPDAEPPVDAEFTVKKKKKEK